MERLVVEIPRITALAKTILFLISSSLNCLIVYHSVYQPVVWVLSVVLDMVSNGTCRIPGHLPASPGKGHNISRRLGWTDRASNYVFLCSK